MRGGRKTIPCPLGDSILIPRLDLVHLKPRWLPVRVPKQKKEKSNSPSSWKKLKGQSYSCSKIEEYTAVISLQMIMVSPGTHFVKNHESQSMNQWFPVKKNKNSTKRKTIGPLCNQTVSLKTDFKTLNYSVRKLKYSPILKHDKNALTAALSLTCLEIRSRNKEAINSTINTIYLK